MNPAISIAEQNVQIFMYELIAGGIVSALKWRMGYVPSLQLQFPFAEPKYVEQYQVNLNCDCYFPPALKSLGLQLKISHEIMHKPFLDSSQTLKKHYLRQLPALPRKVGLLQYVLQFMATHKEVTLEQLSAHMEISPATLKRKLAKHKASFQMLYDLHRQQQAIFRLTTKGDTNETVASALSFPDATNFRRSFKRWTGMTPNAIKQLFSTGLLAI